MIVFRSPKQIAAEQHKKTIEMVFKALEPTVVEVNKLKKENEELKKELEKKTRLLEMTDLYVLDLERLRNENAEQIEAYKKDLLHVVRNLRKES